MKWFRIVLIINLLVFAGFLSVAAQKRQRPRELGIITGTLPTGPLNAITDVAGVRVGHTTLVKGDSVRTGVTAILPHGDNLFMEKVPAAMYVFNGFGKLAGYTQVKELGNMETPIILTNTLSVGTAVTAVVEYTLQQPGNEEVRSVNAVVGETNDGYLNDIRGLHVSRKDVWQAIAGATVGPVKEGCVGAGTGTRALGYKGGIGTASRQVAFGNSLYTVGVLVQTNFGSELVMIGVPVGKELRQQRTEEDRGGSCMIIIATDAPLSAGNLKRLAHRAFIGMGRTTTRTSNGSGDYAIAFSTAYRIPHGRTEHTHTLPPLLKNDRMTPLFQAVEEATEEAIYNSLFMAVTTTGRNGHRAEAVPADRVLEVMNKYGR
ncbi:MAG TPA: S58 family peptidase [Bacteroidetes bacterium]|nr:S58 family peptidase [Bacteroidota bacterium]